MRRGLPFTPQSAGGFLIYFHNLSSLRMDQSRLVDTRASMSQACSLLLPPGKLLGPYLVPRPTERTSATTEMRRTATRAKRRVEKQEHLQHRRSQFAAGTLHRMLGPGKVCALQCEITASPQTVSSFEAPCGSSVSESCTKSTAS